MFNFFKKKPTELETIIDRLKNFASKVNENTRTLLFPHDAIYKKFIVPNNIINVSDSDSIVYSVNNLIKKEVVKNVSVTLNFRQDLASEITLYEFLNIVEEQVNKIRPMFIRQTSPTKFIVEPAEGLTIRVTLVFEGKLKVDTIL